MGPIAFNRGTRYYTLIRPFDRSSVTMLNDRAQPMTLGSEVLPGAMKGN